MSRLTQAFLIVALLPIAHSASKLVRAKMDAAADAAANPVGPPPTHYTGTPLIAGNASPAVQSHLDWIKQKSANWKPGDPIG